jgi:hypothetical protein
MDFEGWQFPMISIDHFRQELKAQMGRASASGPRCPSIRWTCADPFLMAITQRTCAATLCGMK